MWLLKAATILLAGLLAGCSAPRSEPSPASPQPSSSPQPEAAAQQPTTAPTVRKTVPLGNKLSVEIELASFEPNTHQIVECEPQVPCLIDGKPVFGTHRELPHIEVRALTLIEDGQRIALDCSGMYNPRSPREDREFNLWVSRELQNRLVIRGEFADGAATYYAEWEVTKGTAVRTILKCSECLGMALEDFRQGGPKGR